MGGRVERRSLPLTRDRGGDGKFSKTFARSHPHRYENAFRAFSVKNP